MLHAIAMALSVINCFVQVPFQPNTYDCGIHTLWHLKHIIEFGVVDGSLPATHHLRFTNDMVGKRLILAQELLDEGGL